jgi:hypothetical protein
LTSSIVGHFHEYLLRGGFPQSALMASTPQAQKLLREDIVDKVLKRDMTALFGVRRVLELEQTFLYLCMHDGSLLDIPEVCKALEVKKATANNFIALLESTHLIHRLPPFGYGKEVLRARYKVYLADAAIAPSVMLKGKSLLEDAPALGVAVETAFFNHFILARNLPLDGTKPGSSLLSVEGLLGRSPPGEAFWPSGNALGQPASGAQIGFWVFRLFSARWPGVSPGPLTEPAIPGVAQVSKLAVSPTSKSAGGGNAVGLTLDTFQQGSWVLRSGVQRITLRP